MMDLSTLTFTKIKDNPKLVDQSFSLYKTSVVPDKASVEVTDALALTQEDIENLTDQGFDEKTIEAVAQAVNEQLSSNANEEEDSDKTDRKSTTEPHLNAKHQTHNIEASNEPNKT